MTNIRGLHRTRRDMPPSLVRRPVPAPIAAATSPDEMSVEDMLAAIAAEPRQDEVEQRTGTDTEPGQYLASEAHEKVRALFAAAREWNRCAPFPVDGGPCCGGLAQLVVYYCRSGMQRHAKRGNRGYDCFDALGRPVRIKAIGHNRPYFQATIEPRKAQRLIVLRIYSGSWDVIYDGPTKDIRPGQHKPAPHKIVVRKVELDRLAKPRTWERYWHIKGCPALS